MEKSYMLIMQSMKLSSTKMEVFNIYLNKVQIISVYNICKVKRDILLYRKWVL